jgi:hypothetical protein
MFPTADLIKNTQRYVYYDIYFVLLPRCNITMVPKAMCTNLLRYVLEAIGIHSPSLLLLRYK